MKNKLFPWWVLLIIIVLQMVLLDTFFEYCINRPINSDIQIISILGILVESIFLGIFFKKQFNLKFKNHDN